MLSSVFQLVAMVAGAGLLLLAVIYGGQAVGGLVKRGLPKLRRPRHPGASPKREMILADYLGRPLLAGAVLKPGDELELRASSNAGARWLQAKICRHQGAWLLQLPGGQELPAIGQLARWPRVAPPVDLKHAELLRRLKGCRTRCPACGDPERCVDNHLCSFKWDRNRMLANLDGLPADVRKLLQ